MSGICDMRNGLNVVKYNDKLNKMFKMKRRYGKIKFTVSAFFILCSSAKCERKAYSGVNSIV